MKIILSERQYKFITEQTNDTDWLINWFKKVPEEKLIKTFTVTDKNGSGKTITRNEILNLLSDKSKIVIVTDPEEIKRLRGKIAFFQRSWDPKYSDPKNKKYVGKVVINGDWKNLVKSDPMFQDMKKIDYYKHHEQSHLLQNSQKNKEGDWNADASGIISGFCKINPNSFCKKELDYSFGYYQRPEEIYGHLFTIREFLGIEPTDTVIDANAIIQNKIATINVSVGRDGKTIKLPTKTMNTESSTFITIYCCNKSFKQTLMYLHNTLAKVENPVQSDMNKLT